MPYTALMHAFSYACMQSECIGDMGAGVQARVHGMQGLVLRPRAACLGTACMIKVTYPCPCPRHASIVRVYKLHELAEHTIFVEGNSTSLKSVCIAHAGCDSVFEDMLNIVHVRATSYSLIIARTLVGWFLE